MKDVRLPFNINVGFSKGLLPTRKEKSSSQEGTVQQRSTLCTEAAEMTVSWGRRPHIWHCKSYAFNKSIKCKPYVVERTRNRPITTVVRLPLVAGRLGMFIDTWKVLTSDLWVLQAVKGFRIHFISLSSQVTLPAEPVFPPKQAAQVKEELQYLLEKGAVVPVIDSQEGFYSNLLLVPKKNGQMRPAINLRLLNEWVTTEHFKMEGIPTLKDILKSGDWFVKVDLKDAYFIVPVESSHQQYLRFMLDGESYQFTCLPFSLFCTPYTFTKVLKPVMALLRS